MKYIIVVIGLFMAILAACDSGREAEPKIVLDLSAVEELPLDGGSREAAISPSNKVYVVYKVTGSCSSSSTSVKYGLYEGNAFIDSPASVSAAFSAKQVKTFTVKAEKFGTYLKRTIDKTVQYTIMVYYPSTKSWGAVTRIDAGLPQFQFINYYKFGLILSCGNATAINLASTN